MKKILTLLVIFTIVASFVPNGTAIVKAEGAFASFAKSIPNVSVSGGGQSEVDPYILRNSADLYALSKYVNSGKNCSGEYFVLANDIVFDPNANPVDKRWEPIGNSSSKYFAGTFDGKGYKVSGISILTSSYSYQVNGFFGYVTNGTIRRLAIVNSTVKSGKTNENVGLLAGSISGSTNISNCYVSGTVTATVSAKGKLGGFIGEADKNKINISNCYADVVMTGSSVSPGVISGFVGSLQKNSDCITSYYTDSKHPDGHAKLLTNLDKGKMLSFTAVTKYPVSDVWKLRSANFPDLKTYVSLKIDPNYDNRDVSVPQSAVKNANSFANGLTETGLDSYGKPIVITDWPEANSLNGNKVTKPDVNQDFFGWYSDQACTIKVSNGSNMTPVPANDATFYGKWSGASSEGVDTYSFCATQTTKSKEMGVVMDNTYFYPAIVSVGSRDNYTFFSQGKYTIVFTGIRSSKMLTPNTPHELHAYWVDINNNTHFGSRSETFYKGGVK